MHAGVMSALAQLLRELKPEHVTWSQVAGEMGVSPSYVSLLASGKRGASRKQVEEIARYMGVDATGLLIASGHVPDDLLAIMARHPREARAALLELDRRLAHEGSAPPTKPRPSDTPARRGPASITTEPGEGRLTWKAQLRKALLPLLRGFDKHFKAPWNTSRHQVLVLPRYRIYNAKFFFAWFAPAEQQIRYGFWIEKGIEEGDPEEPEWKMSSTWDWHRLIQDLRSGRIEARDFSLGAHGLEAKACSWGPHDVRWRQDEKGRLCRIEDGKSKRVAFSDVLATLEGWPREQWCDFFVSTSLPVEKVLADPSAAAEEMMGAFDALCPLLRKTAAAFNT